MKTKWDWLTKILNTFFGLVVLLFLLDTMPWFDIASQNLKSFVSFAFLLSAPVVMIWNVFMIKQAIKRLLGIVFPSIILIFILIVGADKIHFLRGTWRTQSIIYENAKRGYNTIEFQMQDIGSLGYNKRKVEVTHLTSYFMVVNKVPEKIEENVDWIRVDKDVNEFGLK